MMSRSILLAGPKFTRQAGGLERALADLVAGLAAQGFVVDDATGASIVPEAGSTKAIASGAWFSKLNRSPVAAAAWSRLAPRRRRALRDIFAPRAELEHASRVLDDLDRRLAEHRYDAVLYCVEEAPPGGLALAQARHHCVVPMAIEGLAAELEGGAVSGTILRARGIHPWLGRRAEAHSIRCAILSSGAWAAATVRAGLRPDVVHPVYFGVPLPCDVRALRAFAGRLLYVGRLVQEKGVHVLLDALARARQSDPRLTLTLVTGEGPRSYRSLVRRRIAALGLEDVVDWRAPVPRAALESLFADHDALLFWSPVAEPAPLVTMNAMAAGLPVIVPAPAVPSPIFEDGVTCVAYARRDAMGIARAIARFARDPALGETIAAGGATRIREGFTPEHTARRYAELLEATIATTSAG